MSDTPEEVDGLDWLKKSGHKQSTTRAKSKRDERKASKVFGLNCIPGSGSGAQKGDIADLQIVGECKCTDKQQYTIKRGELAKHLAIGATTGKIPVFRFTFDMSGREKSYVIMTEDDARTLLERK